MKGQLMKKLIFVLLVIFGMSITALSQTCEITFRVYPPENTPEKDKIYIVGDRIELGNWQPGTVALEKTGNGYFEIKLNFPKGTVVQYKITRGSWDKEAVSKDGIVPGNSSLKIEKDDIIEIRVENWRDFRFTQQGGVTGTVNHHNYFYRDIHVLLPKSYETKPEKRYPVLYMHDGQNCFDPSTSFIGVDWQVDEIVDSLTGQGKMQEIIVVAANNTEDRLNEYADTPTGKEYMNFLVNELKPFIDKTYRTLPGRNNTAVMGSSMGGLISFLCAMYHSDIFGKAACLSISLFGNHGNNLFKLLESKNKENLKIYVDTGDEALNPSYKNSFLNLEKILVSKGYNKDKDILFKIFPGQDHSERSWASRAHIPLMFLFGR